MSDAEDQEPQKPIRADERGEEPVFFPGDVACAIRGSNSARSPSFIESRDRVEFTKAQKRALVASGLLTKAEFPKRSAIDAQGTEHVVRFCGQRVEKHQRAEAWVPVLSDAGNLSINRAIPSEYLRRLELQNEMFGDDIRITGLTRGDRFVSTQPTLRGGEPSENEIRDVLEEAGWKRVPPKVQDLPVQLMGSAWWHNEESLVMLDARKPNFKKTDYGVLPIDLILADLTEEIRSICSK
jgi:hypothetical protein